MGWISHLRRRTVYFAPLTLGGVAVRKCAKAPRDTDVSQAIAAELLMDFTLRRLS